MLVVWEVWRFVIIVSRLIMDWYWHDKINKHFETDKTHKTL